VAPPALPPLSHHEVLELSAPFVRHGLHVDLAASERQLRQLLFLPRDGQQAVRWLLSDLGRGRWRLTRTVQGPQGAQASLSGTGDSLPTLLERLAAVPPQRHFSEGPGFVVARHYGFDAAAGEPRLLWGTAQLQGLVLELRVPAVRRVAGELSLQPSAGERRPALPEDLLAVLGWNWARLVPTRQGWTSRLRLRGSPSERTRRAEAALDRAAAHLAQTLAEPPAQYHARLRGPRWAVFFRRGIPTFTAIGLVALVLLSATFKFQPSTTQMVMLYHLPTLVITLSFVLQELPRFEIPPWPRALSAAAW
jgi:hypothetical protein